MDKYPFTVSVNAFSNEEAEAKFRLVFEWAALPVQRDLLRFGLNALNYWVTKKDNPLFGLNGLQTLNQYNCKVYLSGRTQQEAEARFNLIMQWAAYPVDRDWKKLLGCGLRYLIYNMVGYHKEKEDIEKAAWDCKRRYLASKRRMRTAGIQPEPHCPKST